jgi:hypothetical protein
MIKMHTKFYIVHFYRDFVERLNRASPTLIEHSGGIYQCLEHSGGIYQCLKAQRGLAQRRCVSSMSLLFIFCGYG